MGWLRRLLVQFWDVRWTGRFAVLGVLFLGDGYWSVSWWMISWGVVDFISRYGVYLGQLGNVQYSTRFCEQVLEIVIFFVQWVKDIIS
ncbi:uncharacterized protein BO88DRAFT_33715 [Aspergillus vadensis CBS 113365]|uniref:Uncharacterized protein n=1 Tax=Aspergillus vadensis (strain CBS 113365 / IMI 142717 / IBT 24658) TaxID=1448311 RepID=A0A319BUS8_ASPVC|nr:hypothetical protein BO88DRAFT_33715 [Aspergillus vadensis CBS 113365]PYH75279.1 hypothetical protein BO88DRAFT_33715 [Aspergillus vadensis CBS 113365]